MKNNNNKPSDFHIFRQTKHESCVYTHLYISYCVFQTQKSMQTSPRRQPSPVILSQERLSLPLHPPASSAYSLSPASNQCPQQWPHAQQRQVTPWWEGHSLTHFHARHQVSTQQALSNYDNLEDWMNWRRGRTVRHIWNKVSTFSFYRTKEPVDRVENYLCYVIFEQIISGMFWINLHLFSLIE